MVCIPGVEHSMGMNNFIDIINYLNLKPKYIFDVGSRDGLESAQIAKFFPEAKIYAFECHPESYKICLQNTIQYNNIICINKAINIYNGGCKFYPINTEKTITTWKDGNPGASSIFRASGAYDHIEKYVQDEIEVECIRLDSFCLLNNISKIDCIWMDLQGAELLALKSLGDLLKNISIIHTELEMNEMYTGQCLFSDVHPLLINNGFAKVFGNTQEHFGTDFIYVKKDIIS